ncbi:hypothetical protein NS359_15965, partial [Curtobacterium oceanosedimentum]
MACAAAARRVLVAGPTVGRPSWSHDMPSADRPGRTTCRRPTVLVARHAVGRPSWSHDMPSRAIVSGTSSDWRRPGPPG